MKDATQIVKYTRKANYNWLASIMETHACASSVNFFIQKETLLSYALRSNASLFSSKEYSMSSVLSAAPDANS